MWKSKKKLDGVYKISHIWAFKEYDIYLCKVLAP